MSVPLPQDQDDDAPSDPQAVVAITRPGMEPGGRTIGMVIHTRREEAVRAATDIMCGVTAHGMTCLMPLNDEEEVEAAVQAAGLEVSHATPDQQDTCELVVVCGGDGTILRGMEWAYRRAIPVLGVNLGHVGFLAEAEATQIDEVVDALTERTYHVEDRLSAQVSVLDDTNGTVLWQSFAVNEASLEKASRQRMLEAVVAVDDHPLSRWGCDGILISTPTGSTAYAFSAGGPVTWPGVQAFLVVPLSAHALFNRPVVTPPDSTVRVELLDLPDNRAVVWLDGRRSFDLGPGMVLEVTEGAHPIRLARMGDNNFTERLVRKFGLSVEGFRGAAERRRAES